ncbi:MAG TPA: acyl-CoA dehydrogenase [Thermoanaerobaculia bacterium]|nr:acyl-CoA dehydrogenase [Thermoanaerobaculia bacterium]
MSHDRMHSLLLESAGRLFAEGFDSEVHERTDRGEWPGDLWAAIADNGLPAALVPEAAGGVGLGLSDAAAILRLAGAWAVPAPLAESLVGQSLLVAAGIEPPEAPLALAFVGQGGLGSGNGDSTVILSEPLRQVPWLCAETRLVVVADDPAGGTRVALAAGELPALTGTRSVAGEPRGGVAAGPFAAGGLARLETPSADDLRLQLALCRASQIAGAMDRVLDLTLEHAQGREQFGRPIGRFQAVQQEIAVLAGEVAVVGAAADAAVAAWERGDGRVLAACAKAKASDAAHRVAAIAHQVHAAIGFTREHVLHRFTRRLWAWRDEWGSEVDWQEWIGRRAAAAGAAGLWPLIGG